MDSVTGFKKYRNVLFYILIISGFAALIYGLLQVGEGLELARNFQPAATATPDSNSWKSFIESMHHNLTHPLAILLLQIVTIIFTARTFGFLFNKIGQPTVIGEIIAGVFLGPSIMGYWFPGYTDFLFPKSSLGNLQFLSQVGLVLFMFVIGMELDLKTLRNRAHDAIVISHASIIIPYALGMGFAFFIYAEFAPAGISYTSFSLFMGIAMSITAFPVLARIIQERNLTRTKLGAMAITCAAADDITAWCILAAVIAIVKAGSFVSSLYTIALAIGYVFVMLKLVKPFLNRMGEVYSSKESLGLNIVAIIFGILIISAFITEVIGIHALFGAFIAGVIMPPSINFRRILIEKIESVALGLLLPLFFVFTGLRTQIGLLNDGHLWGVCAMVTLIAVVGKFGGSMLAAKVVGQSWKESLSIGALMNTRGLMELVVLNIGYDLGILSPQIFAMMVIMALVTTFMTGPALDLINRIYRKEESQEQIVKLKQKFRMLLSFGTPNNGRKLLRIANLISGHSKNLTEITALHVTPSADINPYQLAEFEKDSFKPLKSEANKLGLQVAQNYKVSNDVREEILNESNSGSYDLVMLGIGHSVFEGSLLGQFIGLTANALNPDKLINTITGKTPVFRAHRLIDEQSNTFIRESKIPVGVFIDHNLEEVQKILLVITSISDVFLLFYAKKIIRNSNVSVSLVDHSGIMDANTEIKEEVSNLENFAPQSFHFLTAKEFKATALSEYQLLLLSTDAADGFVKDLQIDEAQLPSMLLIRA